MTVITIPQNLIKERELVLVPRKQYENLLKYAQKHDDDKEWQKLSKKRFLRFYSQGDAIYDRI